jgi:hypothetical protein
MENLRKEIEELVERLGRQRQPSDSGRPLPPQPDDDDDQAPSLGHTNVAPDPLTGFIFPLFVIHFD